jgi:hypothetical protein
MLLICALSILHRSTSSMPSELSASTISRSDDCSAKLSRPVPQPYSKPLIEARSGRWVWMASATARARAVFIGSSSQVAARRSKSSRGAEAVMTLVGR